MTRTIVSVALAVATLVFGVLVVRQCRAGDQNRGALVAMGAAAASSLVGLAVVLGGA